MIAKKHMTKIAGGMMAAAILLCLVAVIFSDELIQAAGGTEIRMEYESKLFDTDSIISIDILMDEEDWNEMIANAINEQYYQCDVVINGTTFYGVGIRTKGNTSLTAIASDPDSDRYSFKLEFDHYVDGQTCWGLDKLVLNNHYADATYMKEAIIYDMYQYLDVDASLYNYAQISVNGEEWGLYLALEAVEESFLARNYGTENGELYKPDSMDFGGGRDGSQLDMDRFAPNSFDAEGGFSEMTPGEFLEGGFSEMTPGEIPEGGFSEMTPGELPEGLDIGALGMGGGFSMGGNGSNLNYTDDDLDSYSAIWEGEVTKTSESDRKRVVEALKAIGEGTDLETYMDVDNVLKYLAVHTFSVNLDSLSGSMTHNYYLYEQDGQLNIIPWDYNLAFGAMNMGESGDDASSVIHFPIDTPFSSMVSLSDRQFFMSLLEQEEYLERYHEYYRQLVEEYIDGGVFEQTYSRIRSQIDAFVESDPTAFYSYEEYEAAVEMLYDTVLLRAESIRGQLDGSIPSTTEGQKENPSALTDSSGIEIDVMGTFTMNDDGKGGVMGGGFHSREEREPAEESSGETPSDQESSNQEPSSSAEDGEWDANRMPFGSNGMPSFSGSFSDVPGGSQQIQMGGVFWTGGSFLAIVLMILIAKQYRRKRRLDQEL